MREAASTSLLACQLILRDAQLLFTLLASPELSGEKKSLLVYLFDKNGVGGEGQSGTGPGGGAEEEKVRREVRRLSLR